MLSMQLLADIITIGDEILIGQVVDTNSAYIAYQLTDLGITIRKITSIGDSGSEISSALNESISKSDIVILTGGLGPTSDDITKDSLNSYFSGRLIIHGPSLRNIEQFFQADFL